MTEQTAELKLTAEQKKQLTQATRGQLALWKCHKEVLAAKISEIRFGYDATYDAAVHLLIPEDPQLTPIRVDQDWIAQHEPRAPGYFVVYNAGTEDQYESWSPVHVFEQGYSLKDHAQPDLVKDQLAEFQVGERANAG